MLREGFSRGWRSCGSRKEQDLPESSKPREGRVQRLRGRKELSTQEILRLPV